MPHQPDAAMLVFTRTTGYRHESIPEGVAALTLIGERIGLPVRATEDPSVFTDEGLARYAVLVFLDTTGPVLDQGQRAAMQRYVRAGNGFVAIHGAAVGDPDWAWYTGLVGASFRGHPAIQPARMSVVDPDHPATVALPEGWERIDEWYDFATNPRDHVRVLVTVDEGSYEGGTMGADHPIAWCQEYDGGRSFFTALGHTREGFADPAFLDHLAGGITWAEHQDASA